MDIILPILQLQVWVWFCAVNNTGEKSANLSNETNFFPFGI